MTEKKTLRKQNRPLGSDGSFGGRYSVSNQLLGSNTFSKVRKCIQRETGVQRAVKIIIKPELKASQKQALFNEVRILQHLEHANIVRLHEIEEDSNHYYLVTELCEGGDLFTRLERYRRFPETDVISMVK